jgi:predicted Zn-dependent protease
MTRSATRRNQAIGRVQAFLQGDLALADLTDLPREELYDMAAQGEKLYEAGEIVTARKVFEVLTVLNPYESCFHAWLGNIYQAEGELELARVEYDWALSLNERDIPVRCHRAEVLLQLGHLTAAVADLQRITELDPQGQVGHTLRAREIALALGAVVRAQ